MKYIFSLFIIFLFPLHAFKDFEIWWENCLENEVSLETFKSWLGDVDAPSRLAMRNHVKAMQYQTILDVPSGLCVDYFGLQKEKIDIAYQGVDVTPKLVALAQDLHVPIIQGSIEALPFQDSHFDVCYARHILEHLDYYEQALSELIRVAAKEVLVVFFIPPTHEKDQINLSIHNGYLLYHNRYDQSKLEKFLYHHPKVSHVAWEGISEKEVTLHVYLF